MLRTITLDDADGNAVTIHEESGRRQASKVSGLVGVGAPREARRPRPQAHGGVDDTRFEDGRLVIIEGEVDYPGDQAAAIAEFRAIVAPMLQTLDEGASLLKWAEGAAGLSLQRLVKLASEVDPELSEGVALLRYQAQFYAEDPRAYSQTLTTVAGGALSAASGGKTYARTYSRAYAQSGGGIVTLANAGNRPTPVVFRVYGRCVDPQIVHIGSGTRIALTGTVPAGNYLELDSQARTVKMNGVTSQLGFFDSANSTWREAIPGSNQWQLIAADFDASARLDVLARSAYA